MNNGSVLLIDNFSTENYLTHENVKIDIENSVVITKEDKVDFDDLLFRYKKLIRSIRIYRDRIIEEQNLSSSFEYDQSTKKSDTYVNKPEIVHKIGALASACFAALDQIFSQGQIAGLFQLAEKAFEAGYDVNSKNYQAERDIHDKLISIFRFYEDQLRQVAGQEGQNQEEFKKAIENINRIVAEMFKELIQQI